MRAAARGFGRAGLHVLAFSALWKTAPAYVALGAALLPAVTGMPDTRRRHFDGVARIALALAAYLALRAGLQAFGIGDPALFDRSEVLVDWMLPLAFAPLLLASLTDPVRQTTTLWLCALAGCTVGIVSFLAARGIDVLWSGERLGFHLKRPLGIGLYAGCFVILLVGTWRRWWHAARWRVAASLGAIGSIVLYLEVLISAQNRSTFLGLAAALVVGIAFAFLAGSQRRRGLPLLALALASGVAILGLNRGVLEQRLTAEQDVVQTIRSSGLDAAPPSSITARLHMWRYAAEGIRNAPLLGNGFGNLRQAMERDLDVRTIFPEQAGYDHVHNTYLQTLWSQGLIGAGLWGALIAALLRDVVRAARHDPRVQELLPTIIATSVFIAIWAFFDYRLSHPDMQFFSILALLSLRLLGQAGRTNHFAPAHTITP